MVILCNWAELTWIILFRAHASFLFEVTSQFISGPDRSWLIFESIMITEGLMAKGLIISILLTNATLATRHFCYSRIPVSMDHLQPAQTWDTVFINHAKMCTPAMFPCIQWGCLEWLENIIWIPFYETWKDFVNIITENKYSFGNCAPGFVEGAFGVLFCSLLHSRKTSTNRSERYGETP